MKHFCIFIFSALFCLSCATDSFGVYHTVKKGEKVSEISKLYKTDETLIREGNSIPEGVDELEEGSAIFIPGADKVLTSEPNQTKNTEENQSIKEETASNPPVEESETKKAAQINFIWPARGKIVRKFSSTFPKNNGVDIQFEKSTEIRAAADGKVVHSGELPNYGKTVIINHDDNFFTVYTNLGTIIAKEGAAIRQNDVLGTAEASEKNPQPLFHFEIRKSSKSVNPSEFLPEM